MKCPGQDSQYWNKDAIFETKCSNCGAVIEFFKDDTSRRCKACGHRMVNPKMDFGCAAYCQFAEQCIGTLPEEFINSRDDLFKDRVAVEMKRYFKVDFKRISHTVRVARYAEEMGKAEQANLAIVLSAAYLNGIGMPEAEKKYGEDAPAHRVETGLPIAETILAKLNAKEELVKAVLEIIGRDSSQRDGDINYQIVHDADTIADLENRKKDNSINGADIKGIIEESIITASGKEIAQRILLPQEEI